MNNSEISKTELKLCPFCGTEKFDESDDGKTIIHIPNNCLLSRFETTPEDWNIRSEALRDGENYQYRVYAWLLKCFGTEIANDRQERTDRFLEESLELVQSLGDHPKERVLALVDYVYGRPLGEPFQELGGVMVTLAALCTPHRLNMEEAAECELARILHPEIVEKIRAKQAAKPTGSALPVASSCPHGGYEPMCHQCISAKSVFDEKIGSDEGVRVTLKYHREEVGRWEDIAKGAVEKNKELIQRVLGLEYLILSLDGILPDEEQLKELAKARGRCGSFYGKRAQHSMKLPQEP